MWKYLKRFMSENESFQLFFLLSIKSVDCTTNALTKWGYEILTRPTFVASVVFGNIKKLKATGELKTLLSLTKCLFKNCFNGKKM